MCGGQEGHANGNFPGYRPAGGGIAIHGLARAARRSDGQRENPRQGPRHRPPARLHGRQERLQPAPAADPHAGPAVLRGPHLRRVEHQPVLPVDAGIDRARVLRTGLRPAGVVPADVAQLARGIHRQPQGGRADPARLRRFPRLPRQARRVDRLGHPFRALGRHAAAAVRRVHRQRQPAGRAHRDRAPDCAGPSPHRLSRRAGAFTRGDGALSRP